MVIIQCLLIGYSLYSMSNQSFEDGELIQPPPPRPKSAIPFDQAGRAFNDIPKYSNKPGQQSYIVSQFYTFIS
jgi:hypothetical protein